MRIQDLTGDRYDELWQIYEKYFYTDEPTTRILKITNDAVSMKNEKHTFYEYIRQNASYVVVMDDLSQKPEIVGAQILRVASKDDQLSVDENLGSARKIIDKLYEKVMDSINIFEELGVETYLSARGTVIIPQYRGLNITRHMFQHALPKLASSLGVRAMAVVWTNPKCQNAAEHAGFKVYKELVFGEDDELSILAEGTKSAQCTLIKW